MRRSHPVLYGLVLLAAAAIALGWGAKKYIASRGVAAQVASRLEATLGAPVEVASMDSGLGATTLHGLKLYESAKEPDDPPWIHIESLDADVSAWDLLRGNSVPGRLTVKGGALTLRFDRDGQLVTRLPRTGSATQGIPEVRIQKGKITLKRTGRLDMVIQDVDLLVRQDKSNLVLTGDIQDPYWGAWRADGSFVQATDSLSLALHSTDKVHVTQDKLDRIPFISPGVWEEVRVEGDTPVEFHLRLSFSSEEPAHYRVTLKPEATQVHVAAIELSAQNASGDVEIEDDVVRLAHVRGQTAGGEIQTDATLNFREEPTSLKFDTRVTGLDLRALPKCWSLPRQLEGRLSGAADLHVRVVEGKAHTRGRGHGEITEARVAGLPADPIELRLHVDGRRFEFTSPKTERRDRPRIVPPAFAMLFVFQGEKLEPASPRVASFTDTLIGVVGTANRGMTSLARAVQEGTAWAMTQLAHSLDRVVKGPTNPAVPAEEPNYLEANLRLQDVDLGQLVQGLDLKLPFAVSGRVTIELQTGIPLDSPRDPKAYRLRGKAVLPRLKLEGLELEQVHAQVSYRDGVLQMEELRGKIPLEAEQAPGGFAGTAQLQVVPAGDLTARLSLDHIPLTRVLSLAPELARNVEGRLSANVATTVAADKASDLSAWKALGTLDGEGLRVYGLALENAAGKVRLDDGALKLSDVHVALYRGALTGTASIPLRNDATGSLDIAFHDVDMGNLSKSLPALPLQLQGMAGGTVRGSSSAAGPNGERDYTTQVDLKAPRMIVQGIPTERLQGAIAYRKSAFEYKLEGQALGGKFNLDGQYPPVVVPQPDNPAAQGKLRLRDAQLGRLWDALGNRTAAAPLRGTISIDVDYHHAGPRREPVGNGRFVLNQLRWADTELAGSILGDVRLSEQELRFRNLAGTVARGLLAGQLAINLRDMRRSWFNLSLDRAEASLLLAPWPELAGTVDGLLAVRTRGRMGGEWSGTTDVEMQRGKVFGADVNGWRLPIAWSLSPINGSGQATFAESSAQLLPGRATFRANVSWGFGVRLEGSLRFSDVDLQTLTQNNGDLSRLVAGRLNGRIYFHGNDMRSLNDLQGVVEVKMGQTQALQLPVLWQLVPYIAPGRGGLAFRGGELRGRLGRGLLQIQRFNLDAPSLQVMIEGNISFQGRLALEVWANTGQFSLDAPLLRAIGLRIPAAGPIPVGLIVEASRFLSNRVLHLSVTGTIRNPIVRLDPVPLLTQEAIRYFLGRTSLPYP